MNLDVIRHYDQLIDENNDSAHDPAPLRAYMDLWDGQVFIDSLRLDANQDALEIGVGTGRLALRTATMCRRLVGLIFRPRRLHGRERTWQDARMFR